MKVKTEELAKKFDNSTDMLLNIEEYKRILNRGCNLIRFEPINRILINAQDSKAFDLKTYDEWQFEDRVVSDDAKPVVVLIPRTTVKFVDSETNREIEDNELTIDEKQKAYELGIISKTEEVYDLYVQEMYDIRFTKAVDIKSKSKYKVTKSCMSKSDVVALAAEILKCEIKATDTDKTYYKNNILYVSNVSYIDLVKQISVIICTKLLKDNLDYICDSILDTDYSDNLNRSDQLILDSFIYAFETLLGVSKSSVLNKYNLSKNNKQDMICILCIVDILITEVMKNIKFNKELGKLDVSSNINNIRKAEAIINMFNACTIQNKLKGN
jgi:hypothetical protein